MGANVINGGFGFTDLPDLIINSDTGSGARLKPVLKFTKIEDATELFEISQDVVVTVIELYRQNKMSKHKTTKNRKNVERVFTRYSFQSGQMHSYMDDKL